MASPSLPLLLHRFARGDVTEEDEFMRGGETERDMLDGHWSERSLLLLLPKAVVGPSALSADNSQGQPRTTEKKGKRASGISVAISSLAPSLFLTRNTPRHHYGTFRASWGKWEGYTDGVLDKATPAKGHLARRRPDGE